jgi:chromosome segregation ATPase
VGGLDQSLNALRLVEKELATRLQKSELEGIRSEERVEKLRKEVRVLEERCGNSENALKGRTAEVLGLQGAREALERRVGELEGEGGQLKSEGVALAN